MNQQINSDHPSDEVSSPVIVCLSSSPANQRVIREAAIDAENRHCPLIAVFVASKSDIAERQIDKSRLQANMDYAENLGAEIVKLNGDNIALEIAIFASDRHACKLYLGRSLTFSFGYRNTLNERIIHYAPDLDIVLIQNQRALPFRDYRFSVSPAGALWDIFKCVAVFALCIIVCEIFSRMHFSEANIIMVFIFGTVINSVITNSRVYGLVSAAAGVVLFNYLFTEPRYTLFVYETGYQSTFIIMFMVALITGTLAQRLKNIARTEAEAVRRTRVLLDANVRLNQAETHDDIIAATQTELTKLLDRKVSFVSTTEAPVNPGAVRYPIRGKNGFYGAFDIIDGDMPTEDFDKRMIVALLQECALALDNASNRAAKAEAELIARSEQIRANLLRTVSHDLKTPLTAIMGNADNLLENEDKLDDTLRQRLYRDIGDDARWLMDIIENILMISHIQDGRITLNCCAESMVDIAAEAIRHVNRKIDEHKLIMDLSDDLCLVYVDARLMTQVVINLVNNAVTHTQKGSRITLRVHSENGYVLTTVADNGPGVSPEERDHIFEMFYSGGKNAADAGNDYGRSTGLGLPLCRSILDLHGGALYLEAGDGPGAVFTFSLPETQVMIDENQK